MIRKILKYLIERLKAFLLLDNVNLCQQFFSFAFVSIEGTFICNNNICVLWWQIILRIAIRFWGCLSGCLAWGDTHCSNTESKQWCNSQYYEDNRHPIGDPCICYRFYSYLAENCLLGLVTFNWIPRKIEFWIWLIVWYHHTFNY